MDIWLISRRETKDEVDPVVHQLLGRNNLGGTMHTTAETMSTVLTHDQKLLRTYAFIPPM
jgi:hypothetical protein